MIGLLVVASGAAAAVILVGWLRRRYLVVSVVGTSMEPALRHGDRLYARRTRGMPAAGTVVVLRTAAVDPAGDLPELLVKRVTAVAQDPVPDGGGTVPPGHVYVRGDALRSLDSRTWGVIPVKAVVGRVVRVRKRRVGLARN